LVQWSILWYCFSRNSRLKPNLVIFQFVIATFDGFKVP
jgi:hypothetical protein